MAGILVELMISWILLKYWAKEDFNALGLIPTGKHLGQLALGILWSLGFFCLYEFSLAALVHNPYQLNPAYTLHNAMVSFAYVLRTVAYEELMFRGVLLYILMQRLGSAKAVLISAAAFGVYHWFAWNAFGNPVNMLVIFLMTGSAGYVFALAFERTRSMYMAYGLHFGMNLANMVIFSKNAAIGQQLLLKSFPKDPVVPIAIVSIIVLFIHYTGYQLTTYLWVKRYWKGIRIQA